MLSQCFVYTLLKVQLCATHFCVKLCEMGLEVLMGADGEEVTRKQLKRGSICVQRECLKALQRLINSGD